MNQKKILLINGSASQTSSNHQLIQLVASGLQSEFEVVVYERLKSLPHFDPDQSIHNPPPAIQEFRDLVQNADGIIISTPEYIFTIPSGLKNALEWSIATVVFEGKFTGIITASANGEKAHEDLQLILKTAMANLTDSTTLLIQGISGKLDQAGQLSHLESRNQLDAFLNWSIPGSSGQSEG